MYRWHLPDPIAWQKEARITIQQIAWKNGLAETQDDWSCATFWYEPVPSAPLPAFPDPAAAPPTSGREVRREGEGDRPGDRRQAGDFRHLIRLCPPSLHFAVWSHEPSTEAAVIPPRQRNATPGPGARAAARSSPLSLDRLALSALAAARLAGGHLVHVAGSDILRVGLIGCGGRGTGAAVNALTVDRQARLVAMADAFAWRIGESLTGLRAEIAARPVGDPAGSD